MAVTLATFLIAAAVSSIDVCSAISHHICVHKRINKQHFAVQEAATLALIKAVDFGQPLERSVANQVMEACDPASPQLQYTFLNRVCQSGHLADAALVLDTYSEEADQHPELFGTVLRALACKETQGMNIATHFL